MEPNQGRKKKTRRPKRRSSQTSDSQGAAGPSTSGPNSEAGTWNTYHNVINILMSVSKSTWLSRLVINSKQISVFGYLGGNRRINTR